MVDTLTEPFDVSGKIGRRSDLGLGLLHSGFVASLLEFVETPIFNLDAPSEAQVTAYLQVFDTGLAPTAGGWQRTFHLGNTASFNADYAFIVGQAIAGHCDVVAYTTQPFPNGTFAPVTAAYDRFANRFQSEFNGSSVDQATLQALVAAGFEVTFLGVPVGMGWRVGVDRDHDGLLNGDELLNGTLRTNPDCDNDGFADGYEVRFATNPWISNSSVPDPSTPTVTAGPNVVWVNANAVKIELTASEPTRATLSFGGMPITWASPSPRFPGFDVNHSIVIPFLPPVNAPFTGLVDVTLTDPMGHASTTSVSVTMMPIGDTLRVSAITPGTASGGQKPVDVDLTTLFNQPVSVLAGYTVEAFAWYEATGVPLMKPTMTTSQTVNAFGRATFSITVPTVGTTPRKLHFGVRVVRPPTPPGLFIPYVEANDVVNFTTFSI